MSKQEKTILSLSGGMDSTTLLAWLLGKGHQVHCVYFYYGSKHNDIEAERVKEISKFYSTPLTEVNIDFVGDLFKSDLLKSGGKVPKGHYEDENMAQTVVPGRNSIFTSILTGYAESLNYNNVALGQHNGDHAIYRDCRKEYILSMKTAMYLSSEINILAPFIDIDKADICKIGLDLEVPFHITHTCYDPQINGACGECGACVERISSFMKFKEIDPIKYAIGIDWSQNVDEYLTSKKDLV